MVLFTGMKVNFKKEMKLVFEDYAEVDDGVKVSSRWERTGNNRGYKGRTQKTI
jgi:hypothetical protein